MAARPSRILAALALAFGAACDNETPLGVLDAGEISLDASRADLGADRAVPDGAVLDAEFADGGAPAEDAGLEPPACLAAPVPEGAFPTHLGPLLGTREAGVRIFRGVPFAKPPTGPRRLRPPEPPACYAEPLRADRFGSICPQFGADLDLIAGDEDCLYLNVWAPSADAPPRPVLFFVHGGGNILGSGNQSLGPGQNLYDGLSLARDEDVVVVTVNYRLGPLGFFAHPALDAESEHGVSGNYALLDLILALEWVKRNISAVGGDPSRVLLFGESAGALNTCMLLASPLARGLFSAALMQSGACQAPPLAARQATGRVISERLGCEAAADPIACFRSVSVERWLRALAVEIDALNVWDLPYGPAIDGYVIPDAPLEIIRRGEQAPVPLVIGTNAHETELFLPPVVFTCLDYAAWVRGAFSPHAERLLELYPCLDYLLARHAMVDLTTDLVFRCRSRRIARAAAQSARGDVYRYLYRYIRWDPVYAALRSFHASELALVFGTYDRLGYLPPRHERALSRAMQGYWAQFAAAGDPNRAGLTSWPPYQSLSSSLLELDSSVGRTREEQPDEACDFWDSIAP